MINPHVHPKREELLQIFVLTPLQAIRPRIKLFKNNIQKHEQNYDLYVGATIMAKASDRWLYEMLKEQEEKKVNKYKKTMFFLSRLAKEYREDEKAIKEGKSEDQVFKERPKRYDKEIAKEYPCRQILNDHNIHITRMGQFRVRNEKTPSCYLYEREGQNRWQDFGSGEGGDSIALYMKINNCNFLDAVKALGG